jgi:hypothetical protein
MSNLIRPLHEATHRVPGVPEHREAPRGHQSPTRHGRSLQNRATTSRGGSAGAPRHHGRTRHDVPPRVLVRWQNRIARLFARQND